MDDLIKYLVKILLDDDAYAAVKGFVKILRKIILVLLSVMIYKIFIGDFSLLTSIKEIWEFFLSGQFLTPVLIYLLTYFVFDSLLSIIIERIFGWIFTDRMAKTSV